MKRITPHKTPIIKRIERGNFWILGAMLLASVLFCSSRFTVGVALGGAISILGFLSLQGLVRRLISLPAHKGRLRVALYHYIRLGLLFGILGLILAKGFVDPLGLLLGLSVVVLNLFLTLITQHRKILLEV